MKKIGFLISEKENENRRALVIKDINRIKNKDYIYFQKGYGKVIGITDEEIEAQGCNVVDKEEILNCDIICDPKIGDEEDLKNIKNKTIFGWIHATQNYDITQTCIDNKLTCYAWEKMYDGNKHIFYKNNQIAGEAAILHATILYGKDFSGLNVAIIGNGNTAIGASKILHKFGAKVEIYTRRMEENFKREMQNYDIIVNCVLWDVNRKDHIINKEDLRKLKKDTLIIDISCDKNGAIETSIPTTIENPIYAIDGVTHYVVDHTPSLLYKYASESISKEVCKFIDNLIEEKEDKILSDALIIKDGEIIDKEINEYQGR